jgi:hypothetical protein
MFGLHASRLIAAHKERLAISTLSRTAITKQGCCDVSGSLLMLDQQLVTLALPLCRRIDRNRVQPYTIR